MYPVTEYFEGEGVINKQSWTENTKDVYKELVKLTAKKIDTVLMIFSKNLPDFVKDYVKEVYAYKNASNVNKVYLYKNKFLIAFAPMGAPSACGLMEELGFAGVKNFFACGSCGQIDHTLDAANFFLVERAIRDEGTSYKYIKPSVYVNTDENLTNQLAGYLTAHNFKYVRATTWSTDAPFRETPKSIAKRVKQGAAVVDMECAAWCAVAKFRGYKFTQLLYTSDITQQAEWNYKSKQEINNLKDDIIKLMVDFVLSFVKGGKVD